MDMHSVDSERTALLRRSFLSRSTVGVGAIALADLLRTDAIANEKSTQWSGVVKPLHFPQKCKRVIHLCMAGGASHLETFDHKPKLAKLDGQPMPKSFTEGQQIAQLQG